MAVYRIVPGRIFLFKLQKKVLFWWKDVTFNNNPDVLRRVVIECGGVIRK